MIKLDRRRFLITGASVIAAFDTAARQWVTTAEAKSASHELLPRLDGSLATDDAALRNASKDAGFIIHKRPWAVLRPGSVQDIARMIRFCGRHDIPVAARGQGHTPFGQMQVDAGLVIEMATLATIHSINSDGADVDAGVLWTELFEHALLKGHTAPALTGPICLSVGGTLSVGGLSSGCRAGAQVDSVRSLQVVTGRGEIVWCSASRRADLFNGVLAGLGQLGVITRAVVGLVPAPERTHHMILTYTNPTVYFRDLFMLLDRGEIENVFGYIAPPGAAVGGDPSKLSPLLGGPLHELGTVMEDAVASLPPIPLPGPPPGFIPAGAWFYQLHVGKHHHTDSPPNMQHLLRGVSDHGILRQELDRPYREFILRIDFLLDLLKASGMWEGVPHPWIDLFIPGEVAPSFITKTISRLTYDDVGAAGLVLLLPQLRSLLRRPYLSVPDTKTPWVILFDILTSAPAPGPNTEFVKQKVARNRSLYQKARALGATVYPISAVPMEPADWAQHYGPRFARLATLKRRFDPANIMTPGPNMFPR